MTPREGRASERMLVRANDLQVAVEAHGAGPPMVLLHGATSSGAEDWAAQVPLFSRAFRLYVPDARGHAGTRWDVRGGWSHDLLVADLIALADALGLATFHLVGFSMGAMTALAFAARQPARLRTLVVAGISPQKEPRTSVARRLMDPERIARDEPAWAAQLAARHDPVQGPGAWERLLRAIVADVSDQDALGPEVLRAIDCPTLVAVGDRDPFVPAEQAVTLRRNLRAGDLFVAPDCPHPVMAARPALFNEACGAFYRSTEIEARRRAAAGGSVAEAGEGLSWARRAGDDGAADSHSV